MEKLKLAGEKGRGKYALVDDEDFPKVNSYSWWIDSSGYVFGYKDKIQILLHRYVMGEPKGIRIKHINNDRLDNRKENLRLSNKSNIIMKNRMPLFYILL